MRNRKLKAQPFKTFETEEEWIAEIERIVNSVMEKVTTKLTEIAEKEQNSSAKEYENFADEPQTKNAPSYSTMNEDSFGNNSISNNSFINNSIGNNDKSKQMSKAEVEARLREVRRQAEEFAKKNPNFDMEKEMENRHFCYLVFKGGVSVEDAYYIFHKDEILERQAPRISENGATKNQGISTKLNPEKFSDEDVARILERIQDGEQITF